ncbi:metallophosphoesterase [Paenibacillus sp. CCS19]|uniref:metallophosphoesterase n=1 Tax=Paenibacillus sp. CCS19 TaxID=3158387 RepID=UPI00295EE918|nr:metallophosphoesterase [Paenibacillus cellulosilyticus]
MAASSSFDLISDLHLDFWVNSNNIQSQIDLFVDSLIPTDHPTNPSKVLVIAGDLGHKNSQNELLLKSFKRYYRSVLIVFGNHDYYLTSSSTRWRSNYRSANRINKMKQLATQIESIYILDGSTVTIDGITYGGAGMWHDFSFGVAMGFSEPYLLEIWQRSMNDANLILPRFTLSTLQYHFNKELEKLESIFDQSQVIVTHVSPDASNMPTRNLNDPVSTFYYFDGFHLLSRAKGKVWCYGHTHTHADYYHQEGCRLVNNALGYPDEKTGAKIRTIQL